MTDADIESTLAEQRTRYFHLLMGQAEAAQPGPDQDLALDRIERVLNVEAAWAASGSQPPSPYDMPAPFNDAVTDAEVEAALRRVVGADDEPVTSAPDLPVTGS